MNYRTDYAFRIHPRLTEDDPEQATVMYSVCGPEGPWHDMATGPTEWIEEILGALRWCEDERQMRREQEVARLRTEITEYDKLVGVPPTENKFDITLGNQGFAKLASNLVDRLRTVNPYAPVQVVDAEIERLRAAGDALIAAIRNHDLREQHIKAWEARRG